MSNFESYHSGNAKAAVPDTLMGNVETHFASDDIEGKDLEKDYVREVLRMNNYLYHLILRIVHPCENQRV